MTDHDGPRGEWLLRAGERVLSRRIMESVVAPALGDLQHEAALARTASAKRRALVLARGYASVWSALAVCAASWPARSLRDDWLRPEAPGPHLVRVLLPRAAVVAVVSTFLAVQSAIPFAQRAADPWMLLLYLPSAMSITVPIAFLFGIVVAVGRLRSLSGFAPIRWLGAVVGLSVGASFLTFVFVACITPATNQSWRERAYRWQTTHQEIEDGAWIEAPRAAAARPRPRGDRELTLGELAARIDAGRGRGQWTAAWEVEWHKKWAIPATCLLLGPFAIALNGAGRRPRPVLNVAAAMGMILVLYCALRGAEDAADAGLVVPFAIWGGNGLLGLATLWLFVNSAPSSGEGRVSQ